MSELTREQIEDYRAWNWRNDRRVEPLCDMALRSIQPAKGNSISAEPPCKTCGGKGIVPIGDGYSINPCPDCHPPRPALSAERVSVPESVTKFAAWIIRELLSELGDIDDGTAQEKMQEFGLLKTVRVTEPCGECCRCAEYDDFPQDCLCLQDDVQAMLADVRVEE